MYTTQRLIYVYPYSMCLRHAYYQNLYDVHEPKVFKANGCLRKPKPKLLSLLIVTTSQLTTTATDASIGYVQHETI